MVRLLLTACFTATSLFGPALCCCASSAAKPTVTADATVPAKRSCCSSGQTPAQSGKPVKHQHLPGECPCKKGKPDAGLARAEAPVSGASGEWFASGPNPVAPNDSFDLTFRGLSPCGGLSRDVAPVSTADLLRAHHRLRC